MQPFFKRIKPIHQQLKTCLVCGERGQNGKSYGYSGKVTAQVWAQLFFLLNISNDWTTPHTEWHTWITHQTEGLQSKSTKYTTQKTTPVPFSMVNCRPRVEATVGARTHCGLRQKALLNSWWYEGPREHEGPLAFTWWESDSTFKINKSGRFNPMSVLIQEV